MEGKTKTPVELAIAHVLFIDIVGYSKLTTKEQNVAVATLNELVQQCEPFQIAERTDRLLKIPTGDGMALVFYRSPEEPVQCAVALTKALKQDSNLQVRMGVHSGSVSGVADVTGRANVAGAGINIAQRVMDCADGGHILLSKHAADDLAEYEQWRPMLHDLGPCEVKHRVKVHVVNLWSEDLGNSRVPSKMRAQRQHIRRRRWLVVGGTAALVGMTTAAFLVWRAREHARTATLNHSVAVLPFESISNDPDNAILAGGVHREVLTNLAKLADLKVISRTSVMRYKPGTDRNVKQIADYLGVNYVVEGSVQRNADHVHVTVELIDARKDSQTWAESYDGNLADVLTFQTEIAQRISNQLGAKLSPRERTDLATKPTQDLAAFESYVRARTLMETPELDDNHDAYVEDNTRAVELLEQAVARDPQFAAAYWALVEANIQLSRSADAAKPEYRDRAEAALKEAQRLAPGSGETLLAQARVTYYGYLDFRKALATLEQAANYLPNDAGVCITRALLYRRFGRWQEAYLQFIRATELNPQDMFAYIGAKDAACNLRWWADYDQVRDRLVKHFPRMAASARMEKAINLRRRGDVAAGNKELESLNLTVQSSFTALFYRAMWNHDYQEAARLVDEVEKYPELEQDRWDKEVQLVFATKKKASTEAAAQAEKKFEERLRHPAPEEEPELITSLTNVKIILGKTEEAVRLIEDAVKKHPLSEDALTNTWPLRTLAYAYVYAGDRERAIKAFSSVVQVPGILFYGPMKYDPVLDELRKDPRFQAIVEQSKQPFPR